MSDENEKDDAARKSVEEDASTPSETKLLAALAAAPAITPQSALLGTKLGRYEIDAMLGRGGMGVVYRARDSVLDREVALKLVPPDMLSDAERRGRFVREAKSAAAATHANIAAVYDVGEIDGQVFLAMELVEGETLRTRLRRERALSIDDTLTVAKGIARGLSKAHEKGIVHRDLKPDNVIVGEALHVKLLDFGLAKLREEGHKSGSLKATEGTLTYDGRVLGTPSYMSPEQAKGRDVDARTDLFSFGVVVYELLAGERPFRGDSAIEILSAVMRDDPPPLPATIPADVRAIVQKCLEKDLDRRYASAKDLLLDLEAAARANAGATGSHAAIISSPDVPAPHSGAPPSSITSSTSPPSTSSGVRAGAALSEPPPAKPSSALRQWLPLLVAVVGLGLLVGGYFWKSKTTNGGKDPRMANWSDKADQPNGRAVTDHPRPKSNNAAALAAYSSALQNFRDGSIAFAIQEFERSAALDPELAAAHLRVLVITSYKMDTTKAREHFAAASQHRGSLEPRDADLLAASEELIRERPNHAAMAKSMSALRDKYPNDAEVAWLTSTILGLSGRPDEARVAIRKARELDPQFAAALWFEASLLDEGEKPDEAGKLLDECLRLSPSAASCLRIRSGIRASRGDCAGFEADARRMTEIEPRGPRAYEYLAAALATRGAPLDSIRAALDKRASLGVQGAANSPNELRAQADLWVALLAGDFNAAEQAALVLAKESDDESSESSHVVPALTLIDIYEERGEPEKALSVAESFVRRLPAWTANAPGGVRARLVAQRRKAGLIDDAKAQAERDALLRESMEQSSDADPKKALYHWLAIEAQYVSSPAEAKSVLSKLPSITPDGGSSHVHGFEDWSRGKVELLAGHPKEASKVLKSALSTCTAMPTTDAMFARLPFSWMEAHLLLAESLEDSDRPAACDAYQRVIDRWKDAKPRSLSVEKAKARIKTKGCAPSHSPSLPL